MSKYVNIPLSIKYSDIMKSNNTSLSSQQYKKFNITNKNTKSISDLLEKSLNRLDYGIEIGSSYYLDKSPYVFLKTGALQDYSYLIQLEGKNFEYMAGTEDNIDAIKTMNLKKGDLIVSKDANVGEIAILDCDYPNMLTSGAIHKLPIKEDYKYYVLAFIKHKSVREQLDYLVPSGSTIRHGKDAILKCLIPFPMENEKEVVKYISVIAKSIVEKEIQIRNRFANEMTFIEKELDEHQKVTSIAIPKLTISELMLNSRLDAAFYDKGFKKARKKIEDYSYGSETIYDMGIIPVRGPSLAIGAIGNSIYLDYEVDGLYTLIRPTNISPVGVINKLEWLGNKNKITTLNKGELIFGAEGTFRSFVLVEESKNLITNYHGMTFRSKESNLVDLIYVKIILDYMRETDMLKYYSAGGNGGSLAFEYWKDIKFPKFKQPEKEKLVNLFYNNTEYKPTVESIDDFIEYDTNFNEIAGLYDLDKAKQHLQKLLNSALENIINGERISIKF